MRILPVLLTVLIGLSACTTTQSSNNAALEKRVAVLEAQLDQAQTRQAAPVLKDPLMETYTTLQRIQNSPANQISALSYVRGNYGKDVTVYPVGVNSSPRSAVSKVLKNKDEDYQNSMQQLGDALYTPQYSPDVVVYSLDGHEMPIIRGSMEYPAPVKAVTNHTAQSRTVMAEPLRALPKAPAREGRSLTAYSSTPATTATTTPRSLTGY
jgi:hypothetical protein